MIVKVIVREIMKKIVKRIIFKLLPKNIIRYCEPVTEGKKVYLTFDDGPHPTVTPKLLILLK